MSLRVQLAQGIRWDWERGPFYAVHRMAANIPLDPTPGYAHDAEIVRDTLARVDKAWPHEGNVTYHLASLEATCRTNAQTTTQWAKGGGTAAHHVFMSGKRIPPHPAMTRYLVAHEYGHCVEDWIAKRRGTSDDDVIREYAKVRGLRGDLRGTPGRWHSATAEVFACDFRYLVADVATDYWPHPGIPRPERCRAAVRWWERAAS